MQRKFKVMRTLTRNLAPFYFANYEGKTELKDEQGYSTGEFVIKYSEPIKAYGNISGAKGITQAEQFGNSLNYDKVIVLADYKLPITEDSVLCVDKTPTKDADGNLEFDYKVTRIAKTLNVVAVAISKVQSND